MGGIFSIVSAKNMGLGCCLVVEYWSSMNGTLSSGSSVKRKEEREGKGRSREGAREERGSEKRRGKGRMKERGEEE